MNYIALFNLLYSTEISEATKDEIVNKINTSISESYEVKPLVETYLELLDTLVFSTASESLIYNIIDETFSQLSEEAINEVSNEWVKRKVEDSMKARRSAADAANKSVKSGVIGLSQLNRQAKTNAELAKGETKASRIMDKAAVRSGKTPTPSATDTSNTGVLGKLKSAVGKVKSWVDSKSPMPKEHDHVGLGRLVAAKANKDNIGAETLRQQSTHKVDGASKTEEVKQPEVKAETPKADGVKSEVKADDATKATKGIVKTAKKKVAKVVEPEIKATEAPEAKKTTKTKGAKSEVKADDATKAAKKKVSKTAAEDNSTKEATEVKEIKQEDTPKVEAKAEESKPKKSSSDILKAKLARESANRRKDKERLLQTYTDRVKGMTARPGYDENEVQDLNGRIEALKKELGQNQVKANEALSDLAILLLDTNISENCFVEVMEMVAANKANADKVKKRIEKEAAEAMDALHDDIAKGLPESPEKIENFSKIAKREEKFMKRYREKFGNNS